MSLTGHVPNARAARWLNLGALNRIVVSAVLAGLLAALLLTAVQRFQVSGLILQAEVYEEAAARQAAPQMPAARPAHGQPGHDHAHDHLAAADHEQHEHGGWQPENGVERTLYTVLANVTVGVAFGLLLCAAMSLRGHASGGWRAGLLWGLAGYAVFFVAPSLGLPPEVPGTQAAPLHDRQLWWLLTAVCTASGLAMLVLARSWQVKLVGLVLLAAPHLIGAPQPALADSAAPAALARSFIYATACANAVFWLALGGLSGWFYQKFARQS